jgi:hypothetical protein
MVGFLPRAMRVEYADAFCPTVGCRGRREDFVRDVHGQESAAALGPAGRLRGANRISVLRTQASAQFVALWPGVRARVGLARKAPIIADKASVALLA